MAVGSYWSKAGNNPAIAEQWNGKTWRLLTMPAPKGAVGSALFGLSCPAIRLCLAFGDYTTSTDPYNPAAHSLVEIWNGSSWSDSLPPEPHGTTGAGLSGGWCTSATNCIAVGSYGTSSGSGGLAETWNGSHWSILPSAKAGAILQSVSCWSAAGCLAVGSYYIGGFNYSIAESWNGRAWTVLYEDKPGLNEHVSQLNSVVCASASLCMVVGQWANGDGGGGPPYPLARYWNGKVWNTPAMPSPNGLFGANFAPAGLSCTSATNCMSVGSFVEAAGGQGTVAESWVYLHGWRLLAS
jgi:hypothetical protein